ncbi:hypothetical protein LOK49_LG06G01712 [Camellia lanceoleosa]|uniref:Uncharacterized protein n=1 Tax=Camellia lanceoleosa TaxID=1840588 RepID=A0ACC0H900_9ERIC|nr:hypothetical protein LOK49_LG06G01712 [Camellia lanceoleosa]
MHVAIKRLLKTKSTSLGSSYLIFQEEGWRIEIGRITRARRFIGSRTRDGQTKVVREGDNDVAYSWNMKEQQLDKVQEFHKPSTEEGPTFIKDDAIVHSFGPEWHGRVRGLEFLLEHAIGSTVAWPTYFISFDFE